MSIASLLGFGAEKSIDAVTGLSNSIFGGFDGLFTSDEERLKWAAVKQKLLLHPLEMQTAINKIEAAHKSIFVAGWRPFIGWVCGLGLFYDSVLAPALNGISTGVFQTSNVKEVLVALLGFGAYRTGEKIVANYITRPVRK